MTIFSIFIIIFLKFPEQTVISMKKFLMLLLLLSTLLTACAQTEPIERSLFAMDTYMTVRIWGDEDDLDAVCDLIGDLDAALDAEDASSEIGRLNESGHLTVSEETAELLALAVEYSIQTGGAFDPTVRPLVSAWKTAETEPPTVDSLLPLIGTEKVKVDGCTATLSDGAQIDLGGIAKGYTAQVCMEMLAEQGVDCAIVSLGGNVQTLGSKPDGTKWAIGIADPENPDETIAVVRFDWSMALVTSGGYQRYYEFGGVKYHHILEPETGYPAENSLASVTVLAQNGTLADAFSTALFVMGFEEAVEFWKGRDDFEAVFVLKDGSILATSGAAPLLTDCEFEVVSR